MLVKIGQLQQNTPKYIFVSNEDMIVVFSKLPENKEFSNAKDWKRIALIKQNQLLAQTIILLVTSNQRVRPKPYDLRYLKHIIRQLIMLDNQQSLSQACFQLRHMELEPQKMLLTQPTIITIKISKNNSSSYSQCRDYPERKFIFFIQQTEEETPPLRQGQQYTFQQPLTAVGTYHLQCLNYTKIKSTIEMAGKPQQCVIDLTEPIILQSPPLQLQKLAAVQQEEKEQQTKQAPQTNFEKSNSKSDYAEYERIINDEEIQYDYMPNKYLKYFKEEFKLWRDFFEKEPEKIPKEYGSQPKDKVSSGSLSFSQRQSVKEQSVISHLRSQQEVSQFQEQELKTTKIMKKTNSESCYVVDREVSKTHLSSNTKRRPLNTNTSSPHQNMQQFQADTLIDWAYNWSSQQGLQQLSLKKKNDNHMVNQWFTFLHNKFKISQFIYG